MLVIFDRAPSTSPAETVLDEEAVAEVGSIDKRHRNLTIGCAIGSVGLAVGRLYFSVIEVDVGIVERIDVDGESLGMFGKFGGA